MEGTDGRYFLFLSGACSAQTGLPDMKQATRLTSAGKTPVKPAKEWSQPGCRLVSTLMSSGLDTV